MEGTANGRSERQFSAMNPRSPVKVLFAIPELDKGGPDRVFFEILRRIDRQHFSPELMVSRASGYYFSRLPKDIPIHLTGSQNAKPPRYPFLDALKIIRKVRPNIAFATLRMAVTLGVIEPLFPSGTKLVLRQANQFSDNFAVLLQKSLFKHRLARQISLFCFRRAQTIVCQSQDMKMDLLSMPRLKCSIEVIGNPVDTDEVQAITSKSRVSLPGKPSLISVGRLANQKGFDILLEAIALLKPKYPNLHLTILGEGPDGEKLNAMAKQLEVSDLVTFGGFNPEPLPLIKAADLFVLASRYEGFSNASLEAAACGTPVVLTNTPGGHHELIRPGFNGALAPSCDPASMAQTLGEMIDNLGNFNRIGIQEDCRRRFSTEQIVAHYERVLKFAANGASN